jgi:hypothetical protein
MKTKIFFATLIFFLLIVGTASATDYNYTLLKKIDDNSTDYPVIGEQGYDDLINSTMGDDQDWKSFDLNGIAAAVFSPGPDNFGPWFWIIVFGAIGTFMYIKFDSVLIPGALFLIGGGMIGPMLLPEFSAIIWAIVIIGFATLGYLLFRSR